MSLKWIIVELYSRGLSEYLGTTSLKLLARVFGSTDLVQRLFARMPVTMCLLHVNGKQECLVVGPVCDMGLPRFQQILLIVKVLVVSLYDDHRMV